VTEPRKVWGCGGCPLRQLRSAWMCALEPTRQLPASVVRPPQWCPLRSGPLTLALVEGQ
jgi:hypothetical protein